MNLTDTHCHLDLARFDIDREEVIERAWQAGLQSILIPAIDLESSLRIAGWILHIPKLFAAIGVHPNDSLTWKDDTADALEKIYIDACLENRKNGEKPQVVAIGEIGLDYYWNDAPHEHQKKVLVQQLALAAKLGLPVILHLREQADAFEGDCAHDLLEILADWVKKLHSQGNPLALAPGVLHSFSGSEEIARLALDMNFYIGITGPVTYKNADVKRKVVKSLPLDRLLIETDSPYLAPLPKRGLRNEPAFVRYIADKIADIHNKNPEEIAAITSENAARLFSWGG